MEAASARYAARDRFAYPTEPAATPLQRYIQNACSPENYEPNLALCLEISDLINAKQGTAPREAAVTIVGYVNHRNPNVSLLALGLLDICVKNCGYPFHLQISTKEFLNELVRRFPERPPLRNTRVQNKILELIEEWRRTICETSKYKDDLGFIRDMHRLLAYKGYVFPEIRRDDAAVLSPSDNLKSAEEMEAEERQMQSAKLQELIRRGTPRDLQEANKLMKVMAGYDTRHKTDYRAKAAEEVSKIQQKAKILEEMLQGFKPGDEIKEGDVFEELANALASAHPKIQRMCEEESDDHEAVAKLFEINDSIHRTIERYKLFKKGDIEAANAIPKGTLGVSGAGVRTGPDNELSLIDFDAPGEQAAASAQPIGGDMLSDQPQSTAPKPKGNALEDDLLGLNMGDGNYGSGGGIFLGGPSDAVAPLGTAGIMAQFSQPVQPPANSIFSQTTKLPHPPAQHFQSQPQPPPQSSKPNYNLFQTGPQSQSNSKSSTPLPGQAAEPPAKTDPFAGLGSTPRSASPYQFQQFAKAPTPVSSGPVASKPLPQQKLQQPSGIDLLGMNDGAAKQSTSNDDDWTFSSALPDQPTDITVTNGAIRTIFSISRSSDTELLIQSRISNSTPQAIADLTFQLAVTKGYTLNLQPQSSRTLSPHQQNGVQQTIRLQGVQRGNGTSVKLRWRASYTLGGAAQNEQGEIAGLGVP